MRPIPCIIVSVRLNLRNSEAFFMRSASSAVILKCRLTVFGSADLGGLPILFPSIFSPPFKGSNQSGCGGYQGERKKYISEWTAEGLFPIPPCFVHRFCFALRGLTLAVFLPCFTDGISAAVALDSAVILYAPYHRAWRRPMPKSFHRHCCGRLCGMRSASSPSLRGKRRKNGYGMKNQRCMRSHRPSSYRL